MAEAGPVGGLMGEELHRACTVEQEHTCWECGGVKRGLRREDTDQSVTLFAVG